MNQLEHLKALRDKAHVQTEQAKAVLRQQGEITESLDRLIASLEESDDAGSAQNVDSTTAEKEATVAVVTGDVSSDQEEAETGSLGDLIANLDELNSEKSDESRLSAAEIATSAAGIAATGAVALGLGKDESGSEGTHKDIIWVEEAPLEIPTSDKPPEENTPPKLEPIVWEVSGSTPAPTSDEGSTNVEAPAPEENESSTDESDSGLTGAAAALAAAGIAGAVAKEEDDLKFNFLKFGTKEEVEVPMEVAAAIPPPIPPLPIAPPPPPVAFEDSAEEEEIVEAPSPEPSFSQDDDTIAINPSMAAAAGLAVASVVINEDQSEEVAVTESPNIASEEEETQSAVSSNIFFDANSAYLKDSELTKIQAIAEAVSGAEARIVKIQGLEDLASSNDFKVLLASRRVLAVKKKLSEKGVETDQIGINEIQLSEEGRVLEPPSISLVPQTA